MPRKSHDDALWHRTEIKRRDRQRLTGAHIQTNWLQTDRNLRPVWHIHRNQRKRQIEHSDAGAGDSDQYEGRYRVGALDSDDSEVHHEPWHAAYRQGCATNRIFLTLTT